MFSPICFTNFLHNFSQFKQLKKKSNFLTVQSSFFLSLPVEKEIIMNNRETNLWILNSRLVKLSDEFVMNDNLLFLATKKPNKTCTNQT